MKLQDMFPSGEKYKGLPEVRSAPHQLDNFHFFRQKSSSGMPERKGDSINTMVCS